MTKKKSETQSLRTTPLGESLGQLLDLDGRKKGIQYIMYTPLTDNIRI